MTRTPLAPLFTGMTAAALLALSGCSKPAEEASAAAEPTAPSSEYVAENPTEPAVDVNLPASSATSAPAATASPAETAPPAAK